MKKILSTVIIAFTLAFSFASVSHVDESQASVQYKSAADPGTLG